MIIDFIRAELLAARQRPAHLEEHPPAPPLMERLREEWDKMKHHVGSVNTTDCPMDWWRQHSTDFPLLGKYWLANSSFPATSASAERAFNMDGLIFTSKRFVANASWFMIMIYSFRVSLDPDRGNNMLVCKDYWRANIPLDAFSLCSQCPQPPNAGAQYKIQCSKHNS